MTASSRRATSAAVAAAGLAVMAHGVAHANPADAFGFGARAAGMAGAVTADAGGAAATHANPAGVVRADAAQVLLGWGYGHLGLDLNGRDAAVLDAHGSDIALSVPFRLGIPWAFGIGVHLPDSFIGRIQLIPATEPHFVLWDNSPHRFVIDPVLAAQPWSWLSVGAGVTVLADATGSLGFDVSTEGGSPGGTSSIDVRLPLRAAPIAGIIVRPVQRLRLAMAYRGSIDLRLKLGILANVDVAGVLTGDALINVSSINYYTPQRVTWGAAVDVLPNLTVNAELGWVAWSGLRGAVPDVQILINLGITPPLVNTLFPESTFADTIVPRLGVEWRPRIGSVDAAVRAGWSYEPSPVPPQTGLTSFADNDRHVFALGGGIKLDLLSAILARPVALDVALQWHHLAHELTRKDQSLYPGQAFSSSGEIIRASFSVTVEL